MAKVRGKYASPAQAERRKRILRETLKLLQEASPADISMAQIADLSDVSTKTLYNMFKSRNGLLLAAAAQTRTDTQSNTNVMNAPTGISRILELTRQTMDTFERSPEFMESTMSVVVGISAEEEAEHHRVGITQQWFYEALLVAEAEEQLLPGTDCMQLSQILTASQWGVTLMWQKGLISTGTLRRQAIIKHCVDLMPFCRMETRKWLDDLLGSLTTKNQKRASGAQAFEARLST
ncbi:MAG: TetR/AcrR family transcriptional regulator [Pseudomonadota bacterium]